MESLYFYNFLYGSFIYSMLIFMHTDRGDSLMSLGYRLRNQD